MCHLYCKCVAIVLIGLAGAPSALAQEGYFLRITNIVDGQTLTPGSECSISGLIELPDSPDSAKGLMVRARLFCPVKQDFVIANESLLEIGGATKGKRQISFKGTLRLPRSEGAYLLRVDCLDRKEKTYPKSLAATQSLFVSLTAKVKADENR
jgi:hypothetical protein